VPFAIQSITELSDARCGTLHWSAIAAILLLLNLNRTWLPTEQPLTGIHMTRT